MSYQGSDTCVLCGRQIHRILDSDNYPWVHTHSGHPRCKPYDRAFPKEQK